MGQKQDPLKGIVLKFRQRGKRKTGKNHQPRTWVPFLGGNLLLDGFEGKPKGKPPYFWGSQKQRDFLQEQPPPPEDHFDEEDEEAFGHSLHIDSELQEPLRPKEPSASDLIQVCSASDVE